MELVTNSPNSLQLPLIDNQLQSSVGPDAEPVITIELETPEEIPEDNTPDLNIQPQNESEDTLCVNYVLISLSTSHHVLKYFTFTSTTENRHLQTG